MRWIGLIDDIRHRIYFHCCVVCCVLCIWSVVQFRKTKRIPIIASNPLTFSIIESCLFVIRIFVIFFFLCQETTKKTNQTKKKTRYKIQNYCVVFVNAICEVSQCFVQFRIDIYSSRIAIWQREVVHNKEGKKTKCVVHFQLIFDRGVYQLKLNRLKSHPMIMVNMIYFFSVNRLLLATFYRWKSFTQHI